MTKPVVPLPAFPTLARPAWLTPTAWPFQTIGVPSGASTLAVTETGRGPTLLLVHVGAWSFIWRDLVNLLAPNFRCVFFDAPGTGQTRTAVKIPLTLETAARVVADVVNSLDLRDLTLVAHDLGGPASIAAATSLSGRIRAIVGMNSFAWRPEGAALRGMLRLMGSGFIRELDVLTGFLPRLTATAFGIGRNMDETDRRVFLTGMGRSGRRAFHRYMHDALRCDGLYRRVEHALGGPLSRLPLLTVFGERNDPFGFQRRWRQFFPHARQEIVRLGNHFPMCDAPEFVAGVIRQWHRDCVA